MYIYLQKRNYLGLKTHLSHSLFQEHLKLNMLNRICALPLNPGSFLVFPVLVNSKHHTICLVGKLTTPKPFHLFSPSASYLSANACSTLAQNVSPAQNILSSIFLLYNYCSFLRSNLSHVLGKLSWISLNYISAQCWHSCILTFVSPQMLTPLRTGSMSGFTQCFSFCIQCSNQQ